MTCLLLNYFETQNVADFKSYYSSRGDSWMVSLVQDTDCGYGLFVAPGLATDSYAFNLSGAFKAYSISMPPFMVVENATLNDVNVFAFAKTCHYCRLGERDFSLFKKYMKSLKDLESESSGVLSYETGYHLCHALMDTVCLLFYRGVVGNSTHAADVAFTFMKLLRENCGRERKMAFYASKFNVSAKYLAAVISSESGKPVSKWTELFAASLAKRYLMNASLSVNEVSLMMNFRSTSDFSKYFRKAVGMSPNEFRKSLFV